MIADFMQLLIFFACLLLCARPLGRYIANVYDDRPMIVSGTLKPVERVFCRACGIQENIEMDCKQYSLAVLSFSLVSIAALYTMQRCQHLLPLNPESLPAVSVDSSFNTAISFVSNTNWQAYSGETTMSYLTQMMGLTVQNFTSAAVGMAVLVALLRGFTRKQSSTIGNFWVDLIRGCIYILIPLSCLLALALVSQGVVQTLSSYQVASVIDPRSSGDAASNAQQQIAVGPAASQIAIKQLGTNGGGFFNANSAHPLENPTPLSNFLQMISILLIPTALCFAFGDLVRDRRQGRAMLYAMSIVLIPLLFVVLFAEQAGNPAFEKLGVDQTLRLTQSGGNMEGKETRFGIVNSALWSVATTAASNGSVNAMHDSFTPLGGLVTMWLMQLGEVIFGGVGSGLYGMLVFALVAVFIAGLMVGRTPEYLGKKINAFEIKMAALAILLPCSSVLIGTAFAVLSGSGKSGVLNIGPHGFSEILYAFSSASNNNGSAFAGLSANTPYYNYLLGLAMLIGRFGVIFPVLGIAGSLAAKNTSPASPGTLPTHTPMFVLLLVAVVIVIGR